MRKTESVLFVLIPLLGLLLMAGCANKQLVDGGAGAQAMISVSPASKSVAVGETFDLDVVVSNINNLYGFQFDIGYDPAVLEFQKADKGTFLNRDGEEQSFCVDYAVTPGLVKHIACVKLGGDGVSGSGILEKLSFKAITKGRSDIQLLNIKLANPAADEIKTEVFNGEILVSLSE